MASSKFFALATRRRRRDSHHSCVPIAAPSSLMFPWGTQVKPSKSREEKFWTDVQAGTILSLVASDAESDIVEAGLERGEDELNSQGPTGDHSVVKEKGIEIQVAREARFGKPGRSGDAWVDSQGK